MRQVRVGEVMFTDVPTVPPQMTVGEATDRIAARDPLLARHRGLIIVDEQGKVLGLVTQSDLLRVLASPGGRERQVLEAGTRAVITCFPDERVFDALARMLRNDIGRLPVVSREDPSHAIGYFGRASVMAAWSRHLDEERLREHGWLNRWFASA
jgi:chloride channel protein, CIC family